MRKHILPTKSDPKHSVDLFDADLQNEFVANMRMYANSGRGQ